jgi:putative DNA primase/helicase
MFQIIKEKVDIVEAISKEMGIAFKKIGEHNYSPEDETCPFCGHRDCFRIFDDSRTSYYKCFSCEEHGDVINFIAKARDIKQIEAARALAKEHGVHIPNDYSPVQEIFNLAAGYYHNCLKTGCNRPYAELNQLTPLEYQTQIRRHKPESVDHFKIGWSDGNLITYLKGVGFEDEIVASSGLMNSKGGDFLPSRAFIYPHFVKGKVSHFTFKDPLKKAEYQLKNKSKLNNHVFYNSDSLDKAELVAIVEGENDLISVHEAGWQHGLIATIGQLSAQQLEWLENHLPGKKIVTLFDSDDAGDKYRDKLDKIKKKFDSLSQVKLPNVKDIDEYLVNGGNLGFAVTNHVTTDELADLINDESSETEPSDLNIVERDGCYYKIRYKDGMPVQVKLTNFTMSLKNVYIKENERQEKLSSGDLMA